MAIPEPAFAMARKRAQVRRGEGYAEAARYDRRTGRVVVELDNGVQIGVPSRLIEGLGHGGPSELETIEITPSRLGLHSPKLDADLYILGLLAGRLGSRRWMAAHLGAAGGQARSPAKTASARRNGRKGGRPRQTAAAG
jgi:hypothetical protein